MTNKPKHIFRGKSRPQSAMHTQNKLNVRVQAAKILAGVILQRQSLDALLAVAVLPTDARDAALLQELCHGCLRWYFQLQKISDLLLQKPLKNEDSIIYILLLLGLYQLMYLRVPEYAAISETVNAARGCGKPWATALINAVLRNFLRRKQALLQQVDADLSAKFAHPSWLIQALQQTYPDNWQHILQENNTRPPMHLRVNTAKITRAAYLQLLQDNKIAAIVADNVASGITLTEAVQVTALPSFAQGMVSVQDLASQCAVDLLELRTQQRVLDACAAPGGKLTHILEAESQFAEVVAVEINAKRIEQIRENLARLQLHATVLLGDVADPAVWWDGKPFERILLDAPCSATGVIRRHSDIKILRTAADIAQFQQLQHKLLRALWPLLAKGGIFVYSTCSLLPEENWQNIASFLQEHADAKEKIIHASWGMAVPHGRQILPGDSGMDGFYYAVLQKA